MKHLRHVLPLAAMLAVVNAFGQVGIDRPVQLTGTAPVDRRVEGLADPVMDGDALNARTLQQGRLVSGTVQGGNTWTMSLQPAPDSLPDGTQLVVKAPAGNNGPVTLALNGGAALPVLRDSGDPLEPGDVLAGQMVALTRHGAGYLLTSGRPSAKRPCPTGFVQVTEGYCIEVVQRDTADFHEAAVTCGALGGRMCTWGEWYVACTRASQLGIGDLVGDWEWTNNSANGDGLVRVVGEFSCTAAATSQGWDLLPRNFRCCFRR